MDDGVVYFRSRINQLDSSSPVTVLFAQWVVTDKERSKIGVNRNITYRTQPNSPLGDMRGSWLPSTRSAYMICLHEGKCVHMNPGRAF